MKDIPIEKKQAPRNRTLTCSKDEIKFLKSQVLKAENYLSETEINDQVIQGDTFEILPKLPGEFIDLLIVDPPYNLSKNYNGHLFKEKDKQDYSLWFQSFIQKVKPHLKPNATLYICSDWKTSILIAPILEEHFFVHNRITWEREKGRGAKSNWKNNTEDIWFCSYGKEYYFDVDSVKLKRKVIAPYRVNGKPKDWDEEKTVISASHTHQTSGQIYLYPSGLCLKTPIIPLKSQKNLLLNSCLPVVEKVTLSSIPF